MSDAYRVAPIFLIRMAGAPFEMVEQLSTCATSSVAREFLDRQRNFTVAKEIAEELFARRIAKLSDDAFKIWRTAIRQSRMPSDPGMPHPPEFKRYVDELAALTSVGKNLETCLAREVGEARARLLRTSRAILPGYLVFSSSEVQKSLLRSELERAGQIAFA